MKIYFSGNDPALEKLLTTYGDVVSELDWFDRSHVLVVGDIQNKETLLGKAQEMLKPILILSNSRDKLSSKTVSRYPFLTLGQYKNSAEAQTLIKVFFEEYGGIAKENNPYCCGGGCCSNL